MYVCDLFTITLIGGACGIMVIVVEMDTANRAQILDENDCISHSTNTLGKSYLVWLKKDI